jgi:uncharacterized SAM-binding protein YcdF (DUF218 family)
VRRRPAAVALAAGAAASVRLFARPRVDATKPGGADAVVVLDGERPRRIARGVALMAAGVAPTLVVVRCEAYAPELLDGPVPWEVVSFEPVPSSTRGEARAVARLAHDRGWRRLVVVTSTYHVTRTRIIFRRAVRAELAFVAAGYSPARMPLHVASEWVKLAVALIARRSP